MKNFLMLALSLHSFVCFADVYKDTAFFAAGSNTDRILAASKATKSAKSEIFYKCKRIYADKFCKEELSYSVTDSFKIEANNQNTITTVHVKGILKNRPIVKNVIIDAEISSDLKDNCESQLNGRMGSVNFKRVYTIAAAKDASSLRKEAGQSSTDIKMQSSGEFYENSEWKITKNHPGTFFLDQTSAVSLCEQLKNEVKKEISVAAASLDKDLIPEFYAFDYANQRQYSNQIYIEFANSLDEIVKSMLDGLEILY